MPVRGSMSHILAIFTAVFSAALQGSEADPSEHWAFRPPTISGSFFASSQRSPAESPVAGQPAFRGRNPIDAILDGRRRAKSLAPNPPASKPIWLRRVYLDLIGLPPTLAEIRAFEADHSARARETVVERLLARPQHGERWARHFMDIWRYCDWWGLGDQLRYSQKHIWHWRDWIVESLNTDKGYDQMVVEQLAGDELAPGNMDTLRATGFLARNYYLFNRTTWLDDVVEHTTKAFLGLTLNCAKCHDHKYDPIAQTDYYAWRAIFEPYHARLDELPGETDLERDGIPRVYDLHLDRPTYLQIKGDPENPDKSKPIAPGVPYVLAFARLQIQPINLPAQAHQPGLQPWVISNHLDAANKGIITARQTVENARRSLAEAESPAKLTAATNHSSESGIALSNQESQPEPDSEKGSGDSQEQDRVSALERARSALDAAEKALTAAELRPSLVRAVMDADIERYAHVSATNDSLEKTGVAVETESKFRLAEAEANLAKAQSDRLIADSKKIADAEKKLKSATEALEKVRKESSSPATNYTSLRASSKALEGPDETEANRVKSYPATSTGRRLALARWIVDRQNPLTARVLVNHVWTRHFNQPLVPSLTDFGLRSPAPEHQDLLDWLAVDFMEHGWSLKRLHRHMLLSETYAMSSSNTGVHDPENQFYSRMTTQRLDAQALRDSLLYLAGALDFQAGGPTVDPQKDDIGMRRSLYFKQSPEDLHKFLETFDNADPKECYRRAETLLPQQALALANSKLTSVAAAKLTQRLTRSPEPASDEIFIRTAFETILGEKPERSEYDACAESLRQLLEAARDLQAPQPEFRARTGLVQALLNHNDFITIR